MALPFDTCWHRVARAEFHRQALIEIWNGLNKDEVYKSSTNIGDDGNGEFIIRTVKRDWLLPFSLQFGEMIYQLRSGLDSCVYDAAVLHFQQYPPPDDEKWEFKIAASPEKFSEAVRRMKNLPNEIRGIMEAAQPYARATCRFEETEFDLGQTLEMLNDWARIDRHRRLHMVGSAVLWGNLRIDLPVGMTVESCEFDTGKHLIEHDYEIARFKIGNFVPGTEVDVQAQFTFAIAVDETPSLPLQEAALTMLVGVQAVRESFERHFGVKR